MSRLIAAVFATALMSSSAYAQTAPAASTPAEQFFLGVSAGGVATSSLVTSQATATIYNQNAAVAERRDISGGILFEVTAGKPIRGRFAVGATASFRSATSDSAIAASIPHPLFFDSRRTVSMTTTGMKTRQTWVGVLAMYTLAQSGKVTVRAFGGPAVALIKHDVVGGFTVSETSSVTQPALTITRGAVNKSFWGAIGGIDLSYRVTRKLSVGGFVRYAGAPGNLAGVESQTLGGLESGGGLRFSFSKK